MNKYFLFLFLLFVSSRIFATTANDFYNSGIQFYSSKNYQQAIQCFDAAIKIEPNNTAVLMGRANCYYSQEKYMKALSDYQKVHGLQPQNVQLNQFIRALETKIDNMPRSIVWRTPAEGLTESMRTQKPILYDITAEWCPVCRILKQRFLDDGNCAALINLLFVPVRVLDRKREDGKNPPEVQAIEDKFKSRGFPTLVVQHPGQSDFKSIDGYRGKNITLNFLNVSAQ